MDNFAKIGNRLSDYIATKGISQSKLARLTNTSASQVFNMLNGTRYGIDKLLMIFKALPELNPEWLLFGKGATERVTGGDGLTRDQLEKFATENQLAVGEETPGNAAEDNRMQVQHLKEQLEVCKAEKEGLEKIIGLKDEMIEILKQRK